MTSNEAGLGTPKPCLRCLQLEIRYSVNAISRSEAAIVGLAGPLPPRAVSIKWTSVACRPTSSSAGCYICGSIDAACPPSLDLMSGNTEDMVKTIHYIVDTLEMRHPSKFAVAEEDDEFAHLFSHTTRRFVLRALCTLASAFDALTIAHQRDHNLLEQEDVEQHIRIYKEKVLARQLEMTQPEDGSASSKALYLQPGDTGFLRWNKCVEDFRNEVARAMEGTHIAQAAIDMVLSKLPI